ncbi:hypothetical protein BH24ACT3_BH24ACT3_09530 [soil metagenome]
MIALAGEVVCAPERVIVACADGRFHPRGPELVTT